MKKSPFSYRKQTLYVENVPAEAIAERVGTPTYVYSYAAIAENFREFDHAFRGVPHLICYSMKCNSNIAILKIFANLGGGIDIVSRGELFRAKKAGAKPNRIVFSGVGKTDQEIEDALRAGILMFNVEGEQELDAIDRVAKRLKKKAPVALRVNPNINPKTHPYITTGMKKSKFGIQIEDAFRIYCDIKKNRPHLEIVGVDCHIGSQLTQLSPFVDALKKVVELITQMKKAGISIRYLDIGGGLGIRYRDETPPSPKQYAQAIIKQIKGFGLTLLFEPGRWMMGNSGILLSRMLFTKNRDNKKFYIVDAAMNDLIRPAFYESYHEMIPLKQKRRPTEKVDVVGPVCETGDFLALDRQLPKLEPGELLAIMSAGAYGFAMASNYNSRPRAVEVLVKGNQFHVIRKRESLEDLVRGELIPKILKK